MREQDKANLLLDMQEHPENYTDEQLASMLADDEELAEMLEAAAKTKQAMTKAVVDNETLPSLTPRIVLPILTRQRLSRCRCRCTKWLQ